ncbi:hypothetical protein PQQ95_27770 [Paraburkholderia caffeinilytica]
MIFGDLALAGFDAWAVFAACAAFSALTAFAVLTVLVGAEVLADLVALATVAGWVVPAVFPARLAGVDWAAVAAEAEAEAAVSAARALGDAVLRRAGRADPEDVTMGFLREARVC